MRELTDHERKAIASLKRLAKSWPESLWLFSASGTLHVMLKNENNECARIGDGVDQSYSVEQISISNDGGDW